MMNCSRIIGFVRLNSLTCFVRSKDVVRRSARPLCYSVPRYSSETIPEPTPEGAKKVFPSKIENLVDEISRLTLLEVADLNQCLKERLNIPDAAPVAAMMPGMMAAPKEDEDEEVETVNVVKTSFNVKLTGFDDGKKLGLIRFIKENMEGFNLVQAKKFLENLPADVKTDLGKDEATKLKDDLVALGATAEVE